MTKSWTRLNDEMKDQIKKYRAAPFYYTHMQIADIIGCSKSTVTVYLADKPKPEKPKIGHERAFLRELSQYEVIPKNIVDNDNRRLNISTMDIQATSCALDW